MLLTGTGVSLSRCSGGPWLLSMIGVGSLFSFPLLFCSLPALTFPPSKALCAQERPKKSLLNTPKPLRALQTRAGTKENQS